MYDTTLPAKRAVADIVFAYRQILGEPGRPQSLRDFSASLSAALEPLGGTVSHQTVKNWEDRANLPKLTLLRQLMLYASDWRRDFAADMLSAMDPERFDPVTEIGRRARQRSLEDTGPLKPRYDRRYISGA